MRHLKIMAILVSAAVLAAEPVTAQIEQIQMLAVVAVQDLGPTLPEPKVRRLKVGSDMDAYYWTPSPDGTWFSFVDWTTGNLARYDVASDESRDLTNKGTWADSEAFAEVSAISPDGQRIAFAWCCEPGYQLRLIDADGTDNRLLWAPEAGQHVYVVPAAWSPDGKELLVYLLGQTGTGPKAKGGNTAIFVSPESGASRVAWTIESLPDMTQYSPDGRYIAYGTGASGPTAQADLHIRDLETGGQTALVSGPEDEQFLGWNSDGRHVLFHSELDGTPSIWALPIADGARSGPPELVRRDVPGLEAAGAAGGKYHYVVTLERPQVHTMALDIASGRVLQAQEPASEGMGQTTGLADWSPNGEYLAYVQFASATWQSNASLVIQSSAGNNTRHLPLPDLGGERPRTLLWGPDGKRVLVSGAGPTARRTMWVDLASGEATPVPGLESEWVRNGRVVFTDDGRYAFAAGISFQNKLFRVDLESGEIEVVYERPSSKEPWREIAGVALSPDGKTLAVAFNDAIALMPAKGGEPRWIFREDDPTTGIFILGLGISWTSDGQHLVVTDAAQDVGNRAVTAIPVDGGEPKRLQILPRLGHVSLHPDGKRIAYSAGEHRAELWVLEYPD